ncbi:MAG: hypothetical protein B7X06_02025, partial [Verrucomicrobia bacterium 21-51-4]
DARERLEALKNYSQLGSGQKISMKDLELRGAGNLLGIQQSGHIAAVGFDIYCQMLKASVARLKGEGPVEIIRTQLELDFVATDETGSADSQHKALCAYIPAEYILEMRQRLNAYRQLGLADSGQSIEQLALTWADRFGPLPKPVKTLIRVSQIRCQAGQKKIVYLASKGPQLRVRSLGARPHEFMKIGPHLPRLTSTQPLGKLREIEQFINRI